MSYDSTYERIEAYLLNKMSEQERTRFEAQVLADEKLAEQVEQQRMERKMMEVLVEDDLLKDLKRWKDETTSDSSSTLNDKNKSGASSKKLLLGFILLVIFTAIAYWFFNKPDSDSTGPIQNQELKDSGKEINQERLIDTLTPQVNPSDSSQEKIDDGSKTNQNVIEEPLEPKEEKPEATPKYIALANEYHQAVDWDNTILRSIEDSDIFKNLKEQKYTLAIDSLQAALQTDSLNLDYYYLIGMAYSDQKLFKETIPHFERIINSKEFYLHLDRVQWRLSLAYLQNGNVDSSKELLNLIIEDEDHKYNEQATILAQKIDALSDNN